MNQYTAAEKALYAVICNIKSYFTEKIQNSSKDPENKRELQFWAYYCESAMEEILRKSDFTEISSHNKRVIEECSLYFPTNRPPY